MACTKIGSLEVWRFQSLHLQTAEQTVSLSTPTGSIPPVPSSSSTVNRSGARWTSKTSPYSIALKSFKRRLREKSTGTRAASHSPAHSESGRSEPGRSLTRLKSLAAGSVNGAQTAERAVDAETIDVVTLGNLCVDIVKHVDELPPTDKPRRRAYMDAMVAHPPPEAQWEAGGACNTAISGARLGLRCTALGHIGDEVFGNFLRRVLASEGVAFQEIQEGGGPPLGGEDYDGETLLCWVILHPTDGHTFCSRFDFNLGPAFSQLTEVPPGFAALMERSKAVFCNGFVYDELPPPTVYAALRKAREHGAAVFFDPGPRGEAFCKASPYKRECVETLMRLSDVVLMTAEEAETITGLRDQEAAAKALLNRGGAIQWVVIKDGGRGCHMTTHEGSFWLPAYRIDVADTVGCGDSFAAAVVLGFIRGEGPITTLALANAVGAATAMGVGAGRNVAQSDVLASILSDEARQKGTVNVRLKPASIVNGAEPSGDSTGTNIGGRIYQNGVDRGSSSEPSTSNGVLLGSMTEGVREKEDSGSVLPSKGQEAMRSEENGRGKYEPSQEKNLPRASEEGASSLSASSEAPNRLGALEEIRRLQSVTNIRDEEINEEGCIYKLDVRIAAKAAAKLLEQSKVGQTIRAI